MSGSSEDSFIEGRLLGVRRCDVVLAVDRDAAYANLLLPRLLRERDLSTQDAAFATEIAYGTLRWQGVLDEVIAAGSNATSQSLDLEVRAVLRVGRVPAAAHAGADPRRGVDDGRPRQGGCGASNRPGWSTRVMRKVSEDDWRHRGWLASRRRMRVGRLAFEHGYPVWIAEALLDALDGDVTELAARWQPTGR